MGLVVLAEVFDSEGGVELGETGIADEHVLVGVRSGEEGVEVVVVTGGEGSDSFLEVAGGVSSGLADTVVEGLQFLGGEGAEGLAHEADADVAEEFGPAEGEEGVTGFERGLDAVDGAARGEAVVEAGLDLAGEEPAEVGFGDLGPGAEGIGFAHGVGHEDVDNVFREAGEFADVGAEDGLGLAHGTETVEGEVEGLVVLQGRAGGVAAGDDVEDGLGHGCGAVFLHGLFGVLDLFCVVFVFLLGTAPKAVAVVAAVVGVPKEDGPELGRGQFPFPAQGLRGQAPGLGVGVFEAGHGGSEHALGQEIIFHAQDARPRGADVAALAAVAASIRCQAFVRLKNHGSASLHDGFASILLGNRPPDGGVTQIQRHVDFLG